MPHVTVTCPSCAFSREYDSSRIPAGNATATCPKCGSTFPVQPSPGGADSPPAEPVSTAALPSAGADGAKGQSAAATGTGTPAAPLCHPEREEKVLPPARNPFQKRRMSFTFSGTARDYFGIWIVNTMLKIVTFGIYSAWAKVRKRRYFYGNTALERVPFEYLADPFVLFKGWLVAALCFLIYSVGTKVSPVLASTFSVAFFLCMPWLVVRSRIFNLRYSSHRNIRFTFTPNYREAYLVYAGLPTLVPFTLGLLTPYMIYRQKKFLVENSGYGRTRCTFDACPKDFYLVFAKAIGFFALTLCLLGVLAVALSGFVGDLTLLFLSFGSKGDLRGQVIVWTVAAFAAVGFFYLFFTIYVRTSLTNLTWNATRIRNSRFSSTLRIAPMAWLYLSSAAAVLLSCGLLIPWATVRITRYRMEHLALELNDDHDAFLGWGHAQIGSTGEEIGDMFGIELGL